MVESGVGTIVSLLLLISLGIASLVREYDLREIDEYQREFDVLYYFSLNIRTLGPFTIIHGLNHFIVILSFSIIARAYEGGSLWGSFTSPNPGIPLILGIVIWMYAWFYPYLEVTEYQTISPTPNSIFPASIQFHYVFTAISLVLLLVDIYLGHLFGAPASSGLLIGNFQMLISTLYFLSIPITILGFSWFLSREVRDTQPQ